MLVDKSLEELWDDRPHVAEPADFDAFWRDQRDAAAQHPLGARFEPIDVGLETVEVFDVTFTGHGGAPVKGWLLVPLGRGDRLPTVVEFIGYGGGRGLPHERLFWSAAGIAHLVMDTRGQGASWSVGDTADPGGSGAPSTPGFLTRGLADPAGHYFTRLFVDAARAVDAARTHPAVDGGRVAVLGGSQLATYCGTHRDRVDEVFHTLSYLDVVNHARRATAPPLFSVALADQVCPPSTVFAAFHAYGGDKDIRVYPFNQHEGGGAHHVREELAFLRKVLM